MEAFQMSAVACAALGPFVLLAIWVGVIGGVYAFRLLPRGVRRLGAVSLLTLGVMLNPAPAFATSPPTPEGCYWLQASGMPCWMLQALWCPCGDPPPPPPPPG